MDQMQEISDLLKTTNVFYYGASGNDRIIDDEKNTSGVLHAAEVKFSEDETVKKITREEDIPGQTSIPIINESQLTCFATSENCSKTIKDWINSCTKYGLTALIVTENKDWALEVVKSFFHVEKLLVCKTLKDLRNWDTLQHEAFVYLEDPIIYEEKMTLSTFVKEDTVARNVTGNVQEDEKSDDDEDGSSAGYVQDYQVIKKLLTSGRTKNNPETVPRVLISSMSYFFAIEAWFDIKIEDDEKILGRCLNDREKDEIRQDIAAMLIKSRELRIGLQYSKKDQQFLQRAFPHSQVSFFSE